MNTHQCCLYNNLLKSDFEFLLSKKKLQWTDLNHHGSNPPVRLGETLYPGIWHAWQKSCSRGWFNEAMARHQSRCFHPMECKAYLFWDERFKQQSRRSSHLKMDAKHWEVQKSLFVTSCQGLAILIGCKFWGSHVYWGRSGSLWILHFTRYIHKIYDIITYIFFFLTVKVNWLTDVQPCDRCCCRSPWCHGRSWVVPTPRGSVGMAGVAGNLGTC